MLGNGVGCKRVPPEAQVATKLGPFCFSDSLVTQLDIWRFRGEGLGGWVDGWVARWMPQSGDKGVGMVRIGTPPWSNHYQKCFDGNMVAGRRPAHIRHHISWRNMVAGIAPSPLPIPQCAFHRSEVTLP